MLKRNLLSKRGLLVWAMVLLFGSMCFVRIPDVIAGSPCEGDFNYDGDVDGSDLAVFAADFGRTDCPVAGPAPVEKTGQTKCYILLGDDGFFKKGVAWPSPRFTDNGDGTVTDNLTGLIWLKNANCFGQKNWAAAVWDCYVLLADGQCGLTDGSIAGDWRIPNVRELHSLIHYGVYGPALCNTAGSGKWTEGDPFTGVQPDFYWSSSTYAGYTNYAWFVDVCTGYVSHDGKASSYYVWPVRGGH